MLRPRLHFKTVLVVPNSLCLHSMFLWSDLCFRNYFKTAYCGLFYIGWLLWCLIILSCGKFKTSAKTSVKSFRRLEYYVVTAWYQWFVISILMLKLKSIYDKVCHTNLVQHNPILSESQLFYTQFCMYRYWCDIFRYITEFRYTWYITQSLLQDQRSDYQCEWGWPRQRWLQHRCSDNEGYRAAQSGLCCS